MSRLKERTISSLEKLIDRSIEYDSISPSLLLYLEVRDVRIATFTPRGQDNVVIGKVRIYYNLGQLIQGNIERAVKEVRLINSSFSIDQVRDRQLMELIRNQNSPGGASGGSGSRFLPKELDVIGENIAIEYSTAEQEYSIDRLFFELNIRDSRTDLRIKGDGKALFLEPRTLGKLPLNEASSKFEITGQYLSSRNEISGRIQLEDFSSNLLSFKGLTLEAVSTPDTVVLRKIEDSSPYDFLLEYFTGDSTVHARFASDGFIPTDNIRPNEDLYPVSAWLNSEISGEADFQYRADTGDITYSSNLEIEADNEFLPFPVVAGIKGSGTQNYVIFDNLSVLSDRLSGFFRGKVMLRDPFAVGNLTIRRFVFSDDNVLSGSLNIEGTRNSFLISSNKVSIGRIPIENIRLQGALGKEEAGFSLEALYRDPDDSGDLSPNLVADGTFAFGMNSFLELSLNAEAVPLTPAVNEFIPDRPGYLSRIGELYMYTDAYVTTNFDRFSFSLLPLTIEDGEGLEVASCRVNGNNDRLRLTDITLQIDDYDAGGDFEITQNTDERYSFSTALTVNSVYYEIEGMYYQPSTLILRGNHDLAVTLMLRPGLTAFSAQARDMPLPLVPGRISELSLSGRGTYRNQYEWSVQLPDFTLTNAPGLFEENRVELSGSFRPGALQLNRLAYSDPISELSGSGQGYYSSTDPLEGEVQFSLSDQNNQELYSLTASRSGTQIEAALRLKNAPLSRISELPIDGRLSGSADIGGDIESPRIDYTLNLDDGEYQQNLVQVESVGVYADGILDVDYLHAEYNSHILQRGEGSLDLGTGSLQMQGQYRGIFVKRQSSAELSVLGQIEKGPEPLTLAQLPQSGFNAELLLENIQMFGEQHEDWNVSIERSEDKFAFEGGPNKALKGSFSRNGSFEFRLMNPLPVRFKAEGSRNAENFGVNVEDVLIEADFLQLLGVRVVDFYGGRITGDLEITGAPNDPYFDGDLNVDRFSGRVQYVDGTVEPFNTSISLENKTAEVEPVVVTVGDRNAVLSGGFSFDRWNLETIDVNVRTLSPDGLPVLFRDTVSGLNIDGFATGTFQYTLRPATSTISGDLTANNCIITLEDRQEGTLQQRANPLVVDLTIQTGRRVEFLWPRRNFPIIQANADTDQTMTVYYDNITDSLQVRGQMNLKSGEIYYFQRSFYIKEGIITFNENEDKFDPLLVVDAQIKEIDNSGSPVTISLIVDNEPLSSFTPRFESNPTLSTTEIASILGTNLYTQFDSSQGELTSALLITGDLFSQFSIVRSFEQQMKDVFNLDLFSIRTQMIQNVILDRVLNQEISQDPESEGTVGRYLDNTTLFLGKYLGNDLFLEALVQIQQDPITTTGEFGQNELDLSVEVGLEWKTPFFLLNLSVSPDFEEPMNSLQNTSLGFSWDFSY
ncbi:MAG: translocation/assembly module TamB domain-containing protein [Sediminispirochaetaceae bacterium]